MNNVKPSLFTVDSETSKWRQFFPPGTIKVIVASSLGTIFEWYDFFLYGSLAPNIADHFFASLSSGTAFVLALFTFSVGFAFRPLGALIFGKFGDQFGRKYTFLATITIMGVSTFLVGVLPPYSTLGIAAPILLVICRILQGLAVGGEWGGAAIYVGEHSPPERRGMYTGFVQCASPAGLLLSLILILLSRLIVGNERFNDWGWRIPFIFSVLLLIISVFIRMRLHESPVFKELKKAGNTSKSPILESFGSWHNIRNLLIVIFGVVAGQASIGYTSHLYAMFFLTQKLKMDSTMVNIMLGIVLIITTTGEAVFGYLSDKIGRKPIVLTGCFLAVICLYPIYMGLLHFGNPKLEEARNKNPATIFAVPGECGFHFMPSELKEHIELTSACDSIKNLLNDYSVAYSTEDAFKGSRTSVKIGNQTIVSPDYSQLTGDDAKTAQKNFTTSVTQAIVAAGYPTQADNQDVNKFVVFLLLIPVSVYASMGFGPLAAWLVEMFPAKIRYTSLSAAFHIGNGVIGGFSPTIGFSLILLTGNIYAGLWYPMFFGALTVILGAIFLKDTRGVDISQ